MRAEGLFAPLLGALIMAASAGVVRSAGQVPAEPNADQRFTPTAGKPAKGRQVFLSYCATCHGRRGDGKPARGLKLKPPAVDLTSFELSDSFIRRVLQEGVPGTGMAAWNSLPADQLSAVVAYTASLARADQLPPRKRMAPESALRESGRRVYVAHCVRCHGEQGQGDGPEATRYKPPPSSFAEMRPSYAAAARALAEGVPGSAMPAWLLLTPAETQATTFYIRSLYRGPERPAAPRSAVRRRAGIAQR
ncbi:MAG TPA: cytochrome c [Terriglobales bacterium]|nr:cytochrome c [Terriglobales bacterium]